LILEGQGQARSHLKSNIPWSHEWGPVQAKAITHRSREVARDFASTVHRKLIDRPKTERHGEVRASSRRGHKLAGMTILSGPIGAGKTAVSKELITLWSGPLALSRAINSGHSWSSAPRATGAKTSA
jgi:hypothetical protein